ncbi:MAG: class I SAM-dependent methyltransferase [Bdellovibrionales bacterium]|nr:class I SAM-dependent methyltransferase [Bdellovibrionales bacterium]
MRKRPNIFYYRLASLYDSFSAAEFKLGRSLVKRSALRPGEQILEVGCGTGRLLMEIARCVSPGGSATGVDLSEPMIRIARSRAKKTKLEPAVQLLQGDLLNLPFGDETFDKVFSCFTLELFPEADRLGALKEMYRVLRPGGILAVASLNAHESPKLGERLYWWFHKTFPTLVDCRPIPVATLIDRSPLKQISLEEKKLYGIPVALVLAKKPPLEG